MPEGVGQQHPRNMMGHDMLAAGAAILPSGFSQPGMSHAGVVTALIGVALVLLKLPGRASEERPLAKHHAADAAAQTAASA